MGPQNWGPMRQFLQGRNINAPALAYACLQAQAYSASAFFIFFMAATSIWRMRSALTP